MTLSNSKRPMRLDEEECGRASLVEPDATPAKRRKVSGSASRQSPTTARNNTNKRKRVVEPHEEDTLRLLVEPSASVVKRRRRCPEYPRLEVRAGNLVEGHIKGQRCPVLVDSGATNTTMFFSQAKRLGLITGHEDKEAQVNSLWDGRVELQVIRLQEVEITLDGGVVVRTPVKVFPKDLEEMYLNKADAVILGMDVLYRGRMAQKFCGCGRSTITVRQADRLRRRPRQHSRRKCPTFRVRREGDDSLKEVLLDTGASS